MYNLSTDINIHDQTELGNKISDMQEQMEIYVY